MTENEIDFLGNDAAVRALCVAAETMLKEHPVEALGTVQQMWMTHGDLLKKSSEELRAAPDVEGQLAKSTLRLLIESGGDVGQAAREAVAVAGQPQAESLVLLALGLAAIGGCTTVLAILAARVSKITDAIHFYRGLPKSTSDAIKAGASLATPWAGGEKGSES